MRRRSRQRVTEARQVLPDILQHHRKFIMQVRQIIAAALLSVTAVGAMSQELDPRHDRTFTSTRTQESVRAETRNLQAQGALKAVGETAEAPVVAVVPAPSGDRELTRADVKAELAQWRASHKVRVGELG